MIPAKHQGQNSAIKNPPAMAGSTKLVRSELVNVAWRWTNQPVTIPQQNRDRLLRSPQLGVVILAN